MSTFAACVQSVCSATSVTDAVTGHFISASSVDVFVVRANVVALYTWDEQRLVLRLVNETTLPSRVTAVATLPRARGDAAHVVDSVAALFGESRVSIVQWNDAQYAWKTVGAYDLSPNNAATTPTTSERSVGLPPLLRVDTEHDLFLVLTHRQYLHVIPFPTSAFVAAAVATKATADAAAADGWGDESEDEDTVADAAAATAQPDVSEESAAALVTPFAPVTVDLSTHAHLQSIPLRNIRDVVFTPGAEATIAVLREVDPTWAGRVKLLGGTGATRIKALSCGVTFVTLGYARSKSPGTPSTLSPIELGHAEGIPYDAFSLHAAPTPLGGVLAICAGSFAHISSRGTHYGSYLHNHAAEMTTSDRSDVHWSPAEWCGGSAPTRVLNFGEGVTVLPLPGDTASTVRWLVNARDTGVVYQLTMLHDGRSVYKSILARIRPIVQSRCAALLTPDLAFFGATNSDSVLLSITAPNVGSLESGAASQLQVVTSLPTVGPVTDFDTVDATTRDVSAETAAAQAADAVNPFAAVLADGVLEPKAPALELRDRLAVTSLVLCGGRGERQGSLTMLSRHARVEAVLRRVIDCGAVFSFAVPASGDDAAAERRKRDRDAASPTKGAGPSGDVTRVLLMATSSATIAVEFKDGSLAQLGVGQSAFVLDKRTIAAATLDVPDAGRIALQFVVNADQGSGAVAAVKLDTLTAVADSPLTLASPPIGAFAATPTTALFLDAAGAVWRLSCSGTQLTKTRVDTPASITALCSLNAGAALLFAASGDAFVLDLNSFTVTSTTKGLASLPAVVSNDGVESAPRVAFVTKKSEKVETPVTIVSAAAAVLSGAKDTPDAWTTLTLLLSNGELAVYRVAGVKSRQGHALRFVKVASDAHDIPPPQAADTSIAEKKLRKQISNEDASFITSRSRVLYVPVLGSLDAFLVPGVTPKLIVSDRGLPRIHPLRLPDDTTALGFAPLNYSSCEHGIVSASSTQVLFAYLQDDRFGVELRAPWPRLRVEADGTPHKVAYCGTHRATFVATSRLEKFRPTKAPFDAELEINAEAGTSRVIAPTLQQPVSESERIPIPMIERFSIKLFSAFSWKHFDTVTLDENETVVAMAPCELLVKMAPNLPPTLCDVVVVGTAFRLGEDHACRGRILVYGVSVSEGRKRITTLVAENTKGPVTAVTCMRGYVVAAVGAAVRLMELDWASRKMRTISFVHAPAFVTSLSTFKNYIIVGDLQRSLVVARYADATRSLSLIAADPTSKDSLAVGAVFGQGKTLALATYDMKDNLQLFGVHPRLNGAGDPLTSAVEPLAHFKLSGTVRRSMRIRHVTAARTAHRDTSAELYITAEGEIGFVTPVAESAHRACKWVAARMAAETEQPFGLHPLASRQGTLNDATACAGQALIDTQVLHDFLKLSTEERRCIATRSGLTAARALGLLVSINQDTNFF